MESKFRAWDKKNKRMWKVKMIEFGNEYVQLSSFENSPKPVNDCVQCKESNCYSPFYYTKDRIILMQHIGRKDKNDKDIYGGDILELPEWTSNRTRKYEVIMPLIYSDDYDDQLGIRDSEIIGNIYQNPEILKEK